MGLNSFCVFENFLLKLVLFILCVSIRVFKGLSVFEGVLDFVLFCPYFKRGRGKYRQLGI